MSGIGLSCERLPLQRVPKSGQPNSNYFPGRKAEKLNMVSMETHKKYSLPPHHPKYEAMNVDSFQATRLLMVPLVLEGATK